MFSQSSVIGINKYSQNRINFPVYIGKMVLKNNNNIQLISNVESIINQINHIRFSKTKSIMNLNKF
jgi:5,10-methylenetetrahydrofolate reductase